MFFLFFFVFFFSALAPVVCFYERCTCTDVGNDFFARVCGGGRVTLCENMCVYVFLVNDDMRYYLYSVPVLSENVNLSYCDLRIYFAPVESNKI